MKGDDIAEKLLAVAKAAIALTDGMPRTAAGRHVAGQLLQCATSCGANYEEARGAESRADFVHKLAISRKEAQETRFWVRLCFATKLANAAKFPGLEGEIESVCRILGKSVATARKRAKVKRSLPVDDDSCAVRSW
ncbi:MAG: four helix bundle protein [Candidatus Riflebacteria bacterium]|nr:four helix bundle protein [Candidatus Riflebacteria bacterium]